MSRHSYLVLGCLALLPVYFYAIFHEFWSLAIICWALLGLILCASIRT